MIIFRRGDRVRHIETKKIYEVEHTIVGNNILKIMTTSKEIFLADLLEKL